MDTLSQLHRDFGNQACPAARFYEEKSGEARPQKPIKILKAKKDCHKRLSLQKFKILLFIEENYYY